MQEGEHRAGKASKGPGRGGKSQRRMRCRVVAHGNCWRQPSHGEKMKGKSEAQGSNEFLQNGGPDMEECLGVERDCRGNQYTTLGTKEPATRGA